MTLTAPIKRPILCVDFDGVLSAYINGWQGIDVINEEPVPGAMEFLINAVKVFKVNIYSSRSEKPEGIKAMRQWLCDHLTELEEGFETYMSLYFPTSKPPALVSLDDRTITFNGVFPSIDTLIEFKPWNK
jgi:hypothetical protein